MSDDFLIFEKGTRKKISHNFSAHEFDCKCTREDCKITKISKKLLLFLELIRELSGGLPLILNSAFRCVPHNKSVGGKSGSMHLEGRAGDFKIKGIAGFTLLSLAEQAGVKSIGVARGWIHIDDRPGFRRWKY